MPNAGPALPHPGVQAVIIALGAAALVLVVLHEYLLARGGKGRTGRVAIRRLVLLLLLGATALLASALPLLPGVRSALVAGLADEHDLDEAGDPLLLNALAAQRPDRPFPAAGSAADIREWQAYLRHEIASRADADPQPATSPPAVEIVSREQVGNVQRALVRITSWDGTRIPAYVHQPDGAGARPAVLVVPGHGAGIRATAGVGRRDYQHAVALELARHGYVTLTPELRGFGLLTADGLPSHRAVAYAALEAGTFYKAIVTRDLRVALGALEAWPGVDRSRLAAAGTSLGGELTVMLAALDSRVSVVISQAYGGATGPTAVDDSVADREKQTPHGCHTFPGVNRLIWQEDWFRLLAPRPLLVVRGARNASRSLAEFDESVGRAYGALGAAGRFELAIVPGGHEFFLDPAVRFLERWL